VKPQRVVVIGSGFGGLAAAIRLAARGHQVTVLEKRDQPGGRAYVYRQDGFTFDGGPTVITAPWLIDELFALAGRRREEFVEFVPLDPFYRIFFPDGTHFDYSADEERMEREIRRLGAPESDVAGYREFVRLSGLIFAKGFTELATKPFLQLRDMIAIVPDLLRLQSHRSVYEAVASHVRDDRLRQVLSFHPLLVGGNPFDTTSIYTLIHYLEREWGVWYAMGGTGAIVDALARLLGDLGGELRVNAEVARITVAHGRAAGVRLESGEEILVDIVVCNADVAAAYATLLPGSARGPYSERRLARMRYSMSLVVIYFGTNRQYRGQDGPALAHHNIVLGPRYEALLRDIFTRKLLTEDLSLYLHMPTVTDPSLAPPGCEAFYVLAPVPHLGGQVNWAQQAQPTRDRIMRLLEDHYLPGLSRHLATERMIDPRHFRDMLNSYLGAAFSLEPILTQSAWFRPHNRAPHLPNLYFVGAGTHPGAGLPGVLCSAKIVDDLVAAS
jgi:phytoene desaturase